MRIESLLRCLPAIILILFFRPAAFSQTVAPKAAIRECAAGFDEAQAKKKSSPPKRKHAATELPVFQSCVEVHDSPIAIQEHLQAVVRELRWNIGEEQASEELWSFAVYLGANDVAMFTKPPADPKIDWTGGKGVVNVRTNELPDGFTRVIVKAKFDAFGEPEDKFAPQRTAWVVPSSGALETKLTDAVRNQTQTGH